MKKKASTFKAAFQSFKDTFKERAIQIVAFALSGFLILYLSSWISVPSDIKDLKKDVKTNLQTHETFYKSIDSINKCKVNKAEYKEDIDEIKADIKDMRNKIYDIWIKK